MEIRELIEKLEEKYPLDLQEQWDNSGLQIGNPGNDLKNVMISLDLEEEGIDEAIKNNCNLIITHHPYIFNDIRYIDFTDQFYKRLEKVIKNDISVYSMHTNLDKASDGLNDNLAEILNLKNIKILENEQNPGLGRYGDIYERNTQNLAENIKGKLNARGVICYGNMDKKIKTLAVCGGAGAVLFDDCLKLGIDAIVTADVKYHEAMDYSDKGLLIIDPGHFASENHVIYKLKDVVSEMTDSKIYTYSKDDTFRTFI